MGPWHHGQEIDDGSTLGALEFRQRHRALLPPRDPAAVPRPVSEGRRAEGGRRAGDGVRDRDRTSGGGCRRGRPAAPAAADQPTPLYLERRAEGRASRAEAGDAAFDEYVSDPAKPVPFRARPIQPMGYDDGQTWPEWLVDDQREASGRTDVLAFTSDVLTAPVKISGQPIANLIASTSGTDSDWVVKLIDVYPDEVAGQPEMGGYQLMVAARHLPRPLSRELRERRSAIAPNQPLLYRFALPTANHVFLPGHRIMVQVQSSWFPLYDRNPQTFVPNIFWAKPADYRKATQRVYHAPGRRASSSCRWWRFIRVKLKDPVRGWKVPNLGAWPSEQ